MKVIVVQTCSLYLNLRKVNNKSHILNKNNIIFVDNYHTNVYLTFIFWVVSTNRLIFVKVK